MLKQIALAGANPGESRRALFCSAHPGAPTPFDRRDVAKTGSEAGGLAAVRELCRWASAD